MKRYAALLLAASLTLAGCGAANAAEGVVAAAREVNLHVPLVVRLEGTNVDLGKKILKESGLKITSAENLGDAAEKIVKAVKESN